MSNLNFLEFVGRGSTTVTVDGRRVGRYVSAMAEENEETGEIVVCLENQGKKVGGRQIKFPTIDDYENWKWDVREKYNSLWHGAIIECGGKTAWSE